MHIPEYEQRLDALFNEVFPTNHPAMHDYVLLKMELKRLRAQSEQDSRNKEIELSKLAASYIDDMVEMVELGKSTKQASQSQEIRNQALEEVGRIMESMEYVDEDGSFSDFETGYNCAVKDLCAIVKKAKSNQIRNLATDRRHSDG